MTPAQPYFTPTTLQFFTDLKANNNREWFNDHKKHYEQNVKKPFEAFVNDLIAQIMRLDPKFPMLVAKDCIFRIYRDTRFAANKDPYKDHTGAYISKLGKKTEYPGIYFHLTDEDSFYGGGSYMPPNEYLKALRDYINFHLEEFTRLMNEPAFTRRFQFMEGEKNKILPKHLHENAQKLPLLYSKQYFYTEKLSTEQLLSPHLLTHVMEGYAAQKEIMNFIGSVFTPEAP